MSVETVSAPKVYVIRIVGVMPKEGMHFWVGAQRVIETYDFRYHLLSDDPNARSRCARTTTVTGTP